MTSSAPVILASTSPRRRQLLRLIGLDHEIIPARIDESPEPGEPAPDLAIRAARQKALSVSDQYPGRLVLGADTVVEIGGTVLGKPTSTRDAEEMLGLLSGAPHRVHTAVALARNGRCESLLDTATVHFRTLDPTLIRWYVATGEPRDKAGAYAVQGVGGLLVDAVEGSPHTVVGLPIHRLAELFQRFGVDLWSLLRPRVE